jgi:nucleotide-binding universal stress UspA family protein
MVEPRWLVRADEMMSPERILLPLDIRKCPLEIISEVNGLAKYPSATVTLLHVVTLNIAVPEKRVYEELSCDARWYLERLARGCLRPDIATIIRVRFGKVAKEILAEATAGNADLIILPCYPPSFWSRLFAPLLPQVVEQVIRRAACRVFRARAHDRFNCEEVWGRSGNRTDAVSGRLAGATRRRTSFGSLNEAALASRRERHRAAA